MQAHEFPSDSSESDEGIDRSFVEFSSSTERTKIYNDMVHTHLELPALCAKIMNTPQFQRLRNLKQLGLCYYVYPSASHNRFEHCVGTSYLAGKYAKILRRNQPELGITEEDILCLYIAGLCHDLGHGPFSHTWERFMHAVGNKTYSHENMSLRMLDYLLEDNELKAVFEAENLTSTDLIFIKECILGHPLPENATFVGRKPCKNFLYQIVSNERTKIDVDKFDYLLRDCKQLNVTTIFDYQRLMDNSRVVGIVDGAICDNIDEDTRTTIIYRKKIIDTLEDLFRSRFSMHQKAYQHRVTRVIEEMVLDGLKAAEPKFRVMGANDKEYKLSTAWEDTSAFIKLTDSIFEMIMHYDAGGPKAANIFTNVVRRKLYKFICCFSGEIPQEARDDLTDLQKKDPNIRLIETKINFGSGKKNPLNEVLLFEKSRPNYLINNKCREVPEERRTFIAYGTSVNDGSCGNGDKGIESGVKLQSASKQILGWANTHKVALEYE